MDRIYTVHYIILYNILIYIILFLFYNKTDSGPKYRAKYVNIIINNINTKKTTGPH